MKSTTVSNVLMSFIWVGIFSLQISAAPAEDGTPITHLLDPTILLGLAVMLIVAKLAGELFERLRQPAVLGELIGGMALGSLTLFGFFGTEALKSSDLISGIAEIGVILLLFEVGLESNLKEMMAVGGSSLLVATLGVVAPFLLGWAVSAYFLPDEGRLAHIFIGATLCATSVGITARVFKDLKKLSTRAARIILGAAVIDDILGLLILAVVAGAIRATYSGSKLSVLEVVLIASKAMGFLIAAIVIGQFLVPRILRGASRLGTQGVLITFAIALCFTLAWAAAKVGLAPIVGAFAAGLVLDEVHYKPARARPGLGLQELLQPVSAIFVPVFFVWMGLKVDLKIFTRVDILGFAVVLTLAAIIGKQICSLGVLERGVNRVAIGVGMIPRGEVGLIFAGIGATLMLPNASGEMSPVINSATFAAVIIMVIVTTLVTPPALKWAMGRASEKES